MINAVRTLTAVMLLGSVAAASLAHADQREPTLTAQPVEAGATTIHLSGTDFRPHEDLYINLTSTTYSVEVSQDGTFTLDYVSWAGGLPAGEYVVEALDQHSLDPMARTILGVAP